MSRLNVDIVSDDRRPASIEDAALFRERIGTLLLDSEVCYAGSGYCFALARFGTAEDAGILTFTHPDGPWDRWAQARGPAYAHPADDPAGPLRWIGLWCDFANGWTHP
ncbi:DUF6000 family protein [Streptomyces sp. C]|uniref:DUF6000 family protein n=1 Tax=Streptomyces sp. C TaxID=253839 RepID=UPI00101B5616